MFNINKTVENGKAIIKPEGRLDTIAAPEFESAIKETLSEITDLTLDFTNLKYISSPGLRTLLFAHKAMSEKGKMRITNVNKTIMEIFDITGFSEILTIE